MGKGLVNVRTCTEILIEPTTPIHETLQVIDQGAWQMALVIDTDNRLLGTVTDGDIRRAILRGIGLEQPVSSIMNIHPTVITIETPQKTAYTMMIRKGMHRVPLVDKIGRVVGLEILEDFFMRQSRPNWVVIMAGGLGSRLTPLTDDYPKPLLKVGSKPILETILESLVACSFKNFFFSVNYKAEMIENYFGDGDRWGVQIKYLRENKRLGTAGALSLLPSIPDDPVLVINGDLLTNVDFDHLLQFHSENQSVATMCVRDHSFSLPYGVVKIDEQRLTNIVEKPVQQMFINAGIYVLTPEVLPLIPKDAYTDMTGLFHQLLAKNSPISAFPIHEYWLDIGKMDDYLRANKEYEEIFDDK